MKKLIGLSLVLLFFTHHAFSQQRTVEKTFSVKNDQDIDLDLKFGEKIAVRAWDKNTVSFKATIEINNGKLNDALALDFDEQSGRLHITSDYDEDMLKAGRREDCPDRYSTFSWNDGDNGYAVCSHITYELFVPRNADINVESISSDIELVDVTGPVRAKTISGFIDVSRPSGKPANIDMKTISGEAFTDIDELQFINKKDHIPLVGYKIKAKIGSGGPVVSLESISGNIYLRKKRG